MRRVAVSLALSLAACPGARSRPAPTDDATSRPASRAGRTEREAGPLTRSRALGDELNAATARKVIEAIVARSGSPMSVDGCRMYPGTRAGQCLLSGSSADTHRFVTGLGLPPRSAAGDWRPASEPDTCLARPELGVRHHEEDGNGDRFDRLVPRAGTESFGPGTSLPSNHDNVVPRQFYVSPARTMVCIEFDYPYG